MRSIALSLALGPALLGLVMGQNSTTTPPNGGYDTPPAPATQTVQTFSAFKGLATGQSANVKVVDAAGNEVILLLTSLGCKSVPAGQSPFVESTGTTKAGITSEQTCIAACGTSYKLNSYVGGGCYCGTTLKELQTVACPSAARLALRQTSNTGQIVQVSPPTASVSATGTSSVTGAPTSSATTLPSGLVSTDDRPFSSVSALGPGGSQFSTINGVRVLLTSLGCKSVPVGQSPIQNSVSPAAASREECTLACLNRALPLNAFVGNVCYCGVAASPLLVDAATADCAANNRKARRQLTPAQIAQLVTLINAAFANQAPVIPGNVISPLDQPFTVVAGLTPGQAVLATLQNANGQQQRFTLESLGCRQVGNGESPFGDSVTVPAANGPACVTACFARSLPLSTFNNRNVCFCGTVLRNPAPLVVDNGRCQGTIAGPGDVGTVIRATAFGPAPTVSSSVSSSASTVSGTSSSVTGSVTGSSTGSVTGSVTASSTGSVTSASTSRPTSSVSGSSTVSGTATGTSTGTGTSAASATSSALNPINVGGFTYLGCYGSPSSFPGFVLSLSAQVMTNDRCITQCSPTGKRYAATFGNDCFCGDFIDDVNEVKTPEEQCNIFCGGNNRQRCGGRFNGGILKRQLPGVIAADVRFSIYARLGAGVASGSIPGGSVVPTGSFITGVPAPVFPTNIPSDIKCFGNDCYKKIVCYGEYCSYDFLCEGYDCKRRLVSVDGVWRPEACNGFDCGRKVVCTSGKCAFATKGSVEYEEKVTCYGNYCVSEKCSGDACNKKYVCKDDSCVFESCPLSEALQKYEWSGDKYVVVKGCDGSCPTPAPPCSACKVVVPQPPITTVSCNGSTCNTVVISQPPITKVPYQTTPPAVQTGAQPPVQPPVVPGQPPVATAMAPVNGQPPVATGMPPVSTGKAPVNVVTAGSSKFAANFGAFALSVMAAALLL